MDEPLLNGRELDSYRVVDLKVELEKRGLTKSGTKKDLIIRLRASLMSERRQSGPGPSTVMSPTKQTSLPSVDLKNVDMSGNEFIREYMALRESQFKEAHGSSSSAEEEHQQQQHRPQQPVQQQQRQHRPQQPVQQQPEKAARKKRTESEKQDVDDDEDEAPLRAVRVKVPVSIKSSREEEFDYSEVLPKKNRKFVEEQFDESAPLKRSEKTKQPAAAAAAESKKEIYKPYEAKEESSSPKKVLVEARKDDRRHEVQAAPVTKVENKPAEMPKVDHREASPLKKEEPAKKIEVKPLEVGPAEVKALQPKQVDLSRPAEIAKHQQVKELPPSQEESKPVAAAVTKEVSKPPEIKEAPSKKDDHEDKKEDDDNEDDDEDSGSKEPITLRKIGNTVNERHKRQWRSTSSKSIESSETISSETLKDLIPDIKPIMMEADTSQQEEEQDASKEEEDFLEVHQTEEVQEEMETEAPSVAVPQVEEKEKVEEGEDDDDETGPSIIAVTNLVRPFTVNQLRELLARTGQLTDFAINRIKSECVVRYSTAREARETAAALDGVTWPASNPKKLSVRLSDERRLEAVRLSDNARPTMMNEAKRGAIRPPASSPKRQRVNSSSSPAGGEGGERLQLLEAPKPLETLFNKTKALPNIYWKTADVKT